MFGKMAKFYAGLCLIVVTMIFGSCARHEVTEPVASSISCEVVEDTGEVVCSNPETEER